MFVARQHLPAHARGDCCRVPASVFADCGVAAKAFCIGFTQLPFTGIGLHGHAARIGLFVDVDLDRGTAGEVPPGALLML